MSAISPAVTDVVLPTVKSTIEAGMKAGLHIGAQVYVSSHGRVEADFARGLAQPDVPMRTDTFCLWMSATKPITAIAIAQQWENGGLDLDAPVSRYIPEFAQQGKESITVRHILTHTGGFRTAKLNFPEDRWDTVIDTICQAKLEHGWVPGKKAGYHPHTGWYILAEIVQRLSGERFSHYVRSCIFEPLDMVNCWIGMPARVYHDLGDRLMIMHDTSNSRPTAMNLHTLEACTAVQPSSNGYGPANQMGRFYEMLLNGGALNGGPRIIEPETVEWFTTRHREKLHDHTFKYDLDWALGFMVNSEHPVAEREADEDDASIDHGAPYGFGPYASRDAFGHGGNQSSTIFADPDHKLVVAVVFNGMPGEEQHHRRMHQLLAAIYRDVGLVS